VIEITWAVGLMEPNGAWSGTFPGVTVMKTPYGPNVKQEVPL